MTSSRAPASRAHLAGYSSPLLLFLVLCAVWAGLFLPHLASEEFDDEEGRRAWVAREMIETGDLVEPSIWGRTYLAKPPAFPWAVSLLGRASGGVDEWTTRLPSALATLGTALLVAWLAGRMAGAAAAGLAGLFFLCSPQVFAKGSFGELEAFLGLWTFAALAFSWRAVAGRPRPQASWLVLAGVCLAIAILTKGPPAVLFAAAGALGLLRSEPAARRDFAVSAWGPLLLGLALTGLWIAALARRMEWSLLLETWRGEVLERGAVDPLGWLEERGKFLIAVLLGSLPASLVCLGGLRPGRSPGQREVRWLSWTLVASLGVLLLTPGVRGRYAYPLIPVLCVGAGVIVARLERDVRAQFALRSAALVVAVTGVLVAALALVLPWRPIDGIAALGPIGSIAALLAGGLGLWTLLRGRRWRPFALALSACAVLGLLRVVERMDLLPQKAGHRGRRVVAAALAEGLPEGTTLHTTRWAHFNELFYLQRPIRFVESPAGLARDAYVLLAADELAQRPGLVQVLELTLERGQRITLARKR